MQVVKKIMLGISLVGGLVGTGFDRGESIAAVSTTERSSLRPVHSKDWRLVGCFKRRMSAETEERFWKDRGYRTKIEQILLTYCVYVWR
jgi:hypothetical protein